jgi:hypothetical protein
MVGIDSMVRLFHFARILAGVILATVLFVPIAASAHEGHVHHSAAATQSSSSSIQPDAAESSREQHVVRASELRSSYSPAGVSPDCYCCGCCGGAAGMGCCGAALAPDACSDPLHHSSQRVAIAQAAPLPGVPPEALPKPPKS